MAEQDWLSGWEQQDEGGSRIWAGCDPGVMLKGGDALWERGGWDGSGPWNRMWPPQGSTRRGDALCAPLPRGVTPSTKRPPPWSPPEPLG